MHVIETAEKMKALGNQLYVDGQYEHAAAVYRACLALLGIRSHKLPYLDEEGEKVFFHGALSKRMMVLAVVLFLNMAQAYIKRLEESSDEFTAIAAAMVRSTAYAAQYCSIRHCSDCAEADLPELQPSLS